MGASVPARRPGLRGDDEPIVNIRWRTILACALTGLGPSTAGEVAWGCHRPPPKTARPARRCAVTSKKEAT
eukprot:11261016-Alexandrium_andersonii.AAC.1